MIDSFYHYLQVVIEYFSGLSMLACAVLANVVRMQIHNKIIIRKKNKEVVKNNYEYAK